MKDGMKEDAAAEIQAPGMSRTALGVAALRAAHQILDGEPKILTDPVAVRLLGENAEQRLREKSGELMSAGSRALRCHVLVRSRYAEDRLRGAVQNGTGQYAIIGAGLDTFAYRQPEWASRLRIFELDHPASQAAKQKMLQRAGIAVPENVTFVPVDLEHDSLAERLAAAGFDTARPAFLSCLGVLVYLSEPVAFEVLRYAASLSPGSEMVFTASSGKDPSGFSAKLAEGAAAVGEPFRTHFEPEVLLATLRDFGFTEASYHTPEEVERDYLAGRSDGLVAPRRASMVWARK
jgi:methyltransferase (TIGR00027 family)